MSFGAYEDERVVGIIARAARIRYGHFKLTVMPFGLTNAPSVFMELTSQVYTKSKEEHESHLKMNLELLKKDKCHVNPTRRIEHGWSDLGVVIARPSTIWERANVVVDALSRKGGVETSKAKDASREMLRGLEKLVERKEDGEGLNTRQRQWMELFSVYGCETKYHIGKANEVVDAWSRKGGVKPRRVRDICKTVQAGISEKMLVV
nr:reverse transcriptase [Tanacetum cinerariifolium]